MLKWNKKWQTPEWDIPKVSPGPYIKQYAERAAGIPRVHGVWADVHGGVLHIYTLIDDDREVERQLHEVELAMRDAWDDAPVDFRIYRHKSVAKDRLAKLQPVLIID